MDADGRDIVPLADDSDGDWDPAWSHYSRRINFASDRDGNYDVLRELSSVQIVQSINRRYRTMARTKRSRRSYGAGEWGRNRVRVFPDPSEEAGGRVRRRVRWPGGRGQGESRARAAHAGEAL